MEDDTCLQALWQATEDDSATEDEDGVFGEKAQLGPGGGITQAA